MESTDWKGKALSRSKEAKRLNKKIRELELSRDEWKRKSVLHKNRADKLEHELKKIQTDLRSLLPPTSS